MFLFFLLERARSEYLISSCFFSRNREKKDGICACMHVCVFNLVNGWVFLALLKLTEGHRRSRP